MVVGDIKTKREPAWNMYVISERFMNVLYAFNYVLYPGGSMNVVQYF